MGFDSSGIPMLKQEESLSITWPASHFTDESLSEQLLSESQQIDKHLLLLLSGILADSWQCQFHLLPTSLSDLRVL